MKPPSIPLEKIMLLSPIYQATIPAEYRDENGHMNMRWYLAIYDEAGYPLVAKFGLTQAFHKTNHSGGFDLEHHIHYLKEVHIGDSVVVYPRLVARSAKRLHYLMFLVNETQEVLSSIFECVNSFADLTERRTAPYPLSIAEKIDAQIVIDQALDWPAPVCGVMNA